MTGDFDVVVRGGLVVDGTGAEPFEADVAIAGGRIAAIGSVSGRARTEIDARGLIVTPGFVDIHTHYDGQVTWENRVRRRRPRTGSRRSSWVTAASVSRRAGRISTTC